MKLRHFLIVLFVVVIFQTGIYPVITSRVEGHVVDKDTRIALANVEVILYPKQSWSLNPGMVGKATTDANGYFKIDNIRRIGTFFVGCYKSGYANTSPFYLLNEINSEQFINFFELREGQVKHIDIQMEKGGELKMNIQKKDMTGISGYKNIIIQIYRKPKHNLANPQYYYVKSLSTDENGISIIDGLIPGEIFEILIRKDGFPRIKKEILIKKNESIEIYHLYDFTIKPSIAGKITHSEKQLLNASIFLVSNNIVGPDIDITIKSEYQFRDINPGFYDLYLVVVYDNESPIKKIYPIKVERDSTYILNLNF